MINLDRRIQCCETMIEKLERDPDIIKNICFGDEFLKSYLSANKIGRL